MSLAKDLHEKEMKMIIKVLPSPFTAIGLNKHLPGQYKLVKRPLLLSHIDRTSSDMMNGRPTIIQPDGSKSSLIPSNVDSMVAGYEDMQPAFIPVVFIEDDTPSTDIEWDRITDDIATGKKKTLALACNHRVEGLSVFGRHHAIKDDSLGFEEYILVVSKNITNVRNFSEGDNVGGAPLDLETRLNAALNAMSSRSMPFDEALKTYKLKKLTLQTELDRKQSLDFCRIKNIEGTTSKHILERVNPFVKLTGAYPEDVELGDLVKDLIIKANRLTNDNADRIIFSKLTNCKNSATDLKTEWKNILPIFDEMETASEETKNSSRRKSLEKKNMSIIIDLPKTITTFNTASSQEKALKYLEKVFNSIYENWETGPKDVEAFIEYLCSFVKKEET